MFFICEICGKGLKAIFRTQAKCDICGRTGLCYGVVNPSKKLRDKIKKKET